MTEIWFIRHGETDWNRQRRLQGWQDIPLNEFGRNQAGLLASRLREDARSTPIDAIYSSDLQRAHATATPVSEQLDLRVRVEPGIRERGFGVLEGLDLDRIDVLAPEAAAAWRSRDRCARWTAARHWASSRLASLPRSTTWPTAMKANASSCSPTAGCWTSSGATPAACRCTRRATRRC